MPAVEAGSNAKVLVTGANGYIAMWIIHYLLEQGYSVRGTVRSEEKGIPVQNHFKKYADTGKLELVIVADVSKADAYDEAVRGVSAVIHAASPVILVEGDPDDIIKPAVDATLNVLQSSLTYGKGIKRIVFVSTLGTVVNLTEEKSKVYTEEDWNNDCVELVRKLGKDAPPTEKYIASKILAEKAAWEFVKKHKNDIQWDFCASHPSFVLGPFLNDWNDFKSLSTSNQFIYSILVGPNPLPKQFFESPAGCVDVRDVGLAQVLALQKPEAAGERFLLCAHNSVWQEVVEWAHALDPAPTRPIAPLQSDVQALRTKTFDSSKAERVLGIQWIPKEEMIRDTLENFFKRGIQL